MVVVELVAAGPTPDTRPCLGLVGNVEPANELEPVSAAAGAVHGFQVVGNFATVAESVRVQTVDDLVQTAVAGAPAAPALPVNDPVLVSASTMVPATLAVDSV